MATPGGPKGELNTALAGPLLKSASVIGLIQGVAWWAMSLLSLIYHYDTSVTIPRLDTELYNNILIYFVRQDVPKIDTITVTSDVFLVFTYIYLVLSFLWIVSSCAVIWGQMHSQWHLTKYLAGSWCLITALTCVTDVTLGSLLAHDYDLLLAQANEMNPAVVTWGVVMTIAFRGYVLWIGNAVLVGVTLKFAVDSIRENRSVGTTFIDAYDAGKRSMWWSGGGRGESPVASRQRNDANDVGCYVNGGFRRSDSFQPSSGVYIPEPDYSPPATPLKPVLKAKSSYFSF